jgi:hypothetical protein
MSYVMATSKVVPITMLMAKSHKTVEPIA